MRYTEPASASSPLRSILLFSVALVLLAASLWYALQAQTSVNWQQIAALDGSGIAVVLLCILATTVVLPAIQFWLASLPFVTTKRLDFVSMLKLCTACALLNYTPLKAGLIGRVGYLKLCHGIGLRASFFSHAMLASVIGAGCAATLFASLFLPVFGVLWSLALIVALVISALVIAGVLRAVLPGDIPVRGPLSGSWRTASSYVLLSLVLQVLVVVVMALRWWLIFGLLDQPISPAAACLFAVIHIVSVTAGPANGLGLREWLVGWGGVWAGDLAASSIDLPDGVAVSLVDRGLELGVVVLLGSLAFVSMRHLMSQATTARG